MYATILLFCTTFQFCFFIGLTASPVTNIKENNPEIVVDLLIDYLQVKYPKVNFNELIYVGAKRQKLYYINQGKLVSVHDVSTAINGVGNQDGSEKTPLGLHKIQSKIGQNVPLGGVFVGKRFTGKTAEIITETKRTKCDDITSRILTLKGLESGINCGEDNIDTYHRKIYIHGTPEEGLIGQPASHGCIRMKNKEIMDLFDTVSVGVTVVILNN